MWWRALGLEPTADKETVKKTYAELVKTIDQATDIDRFTAVHSAYRMALKSFRTEEKRQPNTTGLVDFEGETHWYLLELANIYNNPKRRLKTSSWEDLFACMSFIEEKHFRDAYVAFFNEHYALTEEIWAVIEKHYPLSNKPLFRWPEIIAGHLNIREENLKGLSFEAASNYVIYKIHVFYGILDKDYERALIFLKMLLAHYNEPELNRWHMVIATELGLTEEIEKATTAMTGEGHGAMATYYRCGHLHRQKSWVASAGLLRGCPDTMGASALKTLADEQAYRMGAKKSPDVEAMPWLALESLSAKEEEMLTKGQVRILTKEIGKRQKGSKISLKLFGGRNK